MTGKRVGDQVQDAGPLEQISDLENNRLDYQQQENPATIERHSGLLFLK